MFETPRVLISGLGAIGLRHLKNTQKMGHTVAVCRRTAEDAQATRIEYGIESFASLTDAALWKPNVILIANPTSEHLKIAYWALEHNCHVFIEKPLAHSLEGIDAFLRMAEGKQLSVAVGCNLRFHPALEAIHTAVSLKRIGRLLSARAEVGQYLPDWHPGKDYRQEYSARAELGGGALLTLIHELDYICWIGGEVRESVGMLAKVSDLEINVEDVAEIICRHTSGALTSIHMDFLDRVYNRRSRWVGELGTIEWIWDGPVRLIQHDGGQEILWYDPTFDCNEVYVKELFDFFDCIKSGNRPRTTGWEAKRVLEIALALAVRRY
jgi:predicted dehydrogenase